MLSYIFKENFIAKKSQYILDIIINAIFTNSKHYFIKFQAKVIMIVIYLKNVFLIISKKKVLKKLWTLKRQNIDYLVIFKCLTYVEI